MPSDSVDFSEIFECRLCGACCNGFGGTYVTKAEVQRIARYLELEVDVVVSKYITRSGTRMLVSQREDGYCVFWDKICTIHPVKPKMCKNWPFIESVLIDVQNWFLMASCCPGMRTDKSADEILAMVKKILLKNSEDS
jgi:hypothetical protein